jgi:hypothetical protein
MTMARRRFIAASTGGALALAAGPARAAPPPTVEIISLAHWPVQNALEPIRDMLAKYDGRIRVIEMNAEAAGGVRRLESIGLKGHIPIVILIDGEIRFERADGTVVEFVNFPAAADNPMGLGGSWTAADVEAAIVQRSR